MPAASVASMTAVASVSALAAAASVASMRSAILSSVMSSIRVAIWSAVLASVRTIWTFGAFGAFAGALGVLQALDGAAEFVNLSLVASLLDLRDFEHFEDVFHRLQGLFQRGDDLFYVLDGIVNRGGRLRGGVVWLVVGTRLRWALGTGLWARVDGGRGHYWGRRLRSGGRRLCGCGCGWLRGWGRRFWNGLGCGRLGRLVGGLVCGVAGAFLGERGVHGWSFVLDGLFVIRVAGSVLGFVGMILGFGGGFFAWSRCLGCVGFLDCDEFLGRLNGGVESGAAATVPHTAAAAAGAFSQWGTDLVWVNWCRRCRFSVRHRRR